MYTEEKVKTLLMDRHHRGASLRALASEYGNEITCADLSRILAHGKFPRGAQKRAALGLAPVCPVCYQKMPRPPRLTKYDPDEMKAVVAFLQERELTSRKVYGRGGKRIG